MLKIWRWETDARPGLHAEGPQGLIDEMMRIEDADVVVGIFWKRFGTPTATARSGTEHELRKAWASWQDHGRPDVMVYFCVRPAAPETQADAEQWGRVLAFRQEMPQEQLWWAYDEVAAFERLIREHLTHILLRRDGGPAECKTARHDVRPTRGPIRFNIPRVATAFTGRQEELRALEDVLDASGTAVITQAITGLGGVGKSQLAAAFVHRHLDDYPVVAWVRAEDGGAADLAGLATKLGIAVDGLALEDQARKAVDWLSSTDCRWLLVLDNVPAPENLVDLAPTVGIGHVLVTSRHRGMGEWGDTLELDVFDEGTAASYLMQRAGRPHDEEGAAQLARALGRLPLALSHAGAYCASGTSFGEYLDLLEHLPARELFETSPERSHVQTVTSTWRVSIAAAAERAALATVALDTAAFLGPEAIPKSLFVALLADAADPRHAKALHDAFNALAQYSLVSATDQVLNVHRLLQKVVREDRIAEGAVDGWHYALKALSLRFPAQIDRPEEWAVCEQLLPHVAALTHNRQLVGSGAEPFVRLVNRATHYLVWADRYAAAPTLVDEAAAWAEELLGSEHPATLDARNRAAFRRRRDGRIEEACSLFEQHVVDTERILGRDHYGALRSRLDLAASYRSADRLDDAIGILEPLLLDHERLLGDKDSKTLSVRQEVAAAYLEVGRVDDSIRVLEPLAADRIATSGPTHPSTLTTRSTLAAAYRSAGRLVEATALQKQLLSSCRETLGPDHRTTLITQCHLASCYSAEGNNQAAIELSEDAIARLGPTLGEDHPEVLRMTFNLAFAYFRAGRHADAVSLVADLLPRAEGVLGQDHNDVRLLRRFSGDLEGSPLPEADATL